MKRQTQVILYHLLPIAFWLLAAVVCVVTYLLSPSLEGREGVGFFAPAVLSLLSVRLIHRIPRLGDSTEPSFQVALLLGIASYWLPSVLFLIPPIWIYLIYRNIFSFRSITATLIGLALVAVWAALAVFMGWLPNEWADFFASKNALGWIPVGAFLIAYITSTIARRNLRVR